MGNGRKLIRIQAVREKTGHRDSFIYAQMAAGKFPKSVPIGGNSRAWVEDEVDAWIEARIAARDGVEAA